MSYAQLNTRANRVAHRLIAAGVGPESIVGLCVERAPEMIVGLLAVSKAGGAYLPLDPAYPKARLRQMLDDASPPMVLFSAAAARLWRERELPAVAQPLILETARRAGGPRRRRARSLRSGASRTARAQTSGLCHLYVRLDRNAQGGGGDARRLERTRGRIGAPVSSRAGIARAAILLAELRRVRLRCRNGAEQRRGAGPEAGGRLGRRSAARGPGRTAHHPFGLSASVLPTLTPGDDLALECLMVGGESCPPALIAEWSSTLRLINAYGPTECTVSAMLSAPLRGAVVAPLGAPLVGTRVYVLDASLEPVPLGAHGELYIAGVGLARGYLGRPALTAERFVPDPYGEPGSRMYRSGDRVLRRTDGSLEFAGRVDQQVKLRGFRVELGDIEAALRDIEGVRQAAALVREDEPGARILTAYVVPRTEGELDVAALRSALAARLPDYMVPAAFVRLAQLPVTSNGKLDRRALPKPGKGALGSAPYEAPRNLTEERVASIWREILHVERVDRDDDFFELGGHSLLALQVIARVRDLFELELPLKDVFTERSLAALACRIDLAVADRDHAPVLASIRAHAAEGPAPLSYSQERMWLIQSLNPGTTAYNMGSALHIRGNLDPRNMIESFDELIERHPILRSSVRLIDDRPVQTVEPATRKVLPYVDLRQEPDPYGAALQRVADMNRTPFHLGAEPVARAGLFRIGDEAHILALVLHHIAGDQWSLGVLGRELASLYNHRRRGIAFRAAGTAGQLSDYSVWHAAPPLAPSSSTSSISGGSSSARCPPSICPPIIRGRACGPRTGHITSGRFPRRCSSS